MMVNEASSLFCTKHHVSLLTGFNCVRVLVARAYVSVLCQSRKFSLIHSVVVVSLITTKCIFTHSLTYYGCVLDKQVVRKKQQQNKFSNLNSLISKAYMQEAFAFLIKSQAACHQAHIHFQPKIK